MIIGLLVISAIAFFISFIYIDKMTTRLIATGIAGVILIISLFAIVANYHSHYGMEKVETVKTQQIYSADRTGRLDMLLFQPIGTAGKENIYIYSKHDDSKKVSHTQANEFTTSHVKQHNADKAELKTTEIRWRYKSKAYRFWFGIADNNHILVKRTNTFYLPKNWHTLSTNQAKMLQQKLTSSEFKQQAKTQAAEFIGNKMKAAMSKNPELMTDKAKQAALQKQLTAEFQAQLIEKTISDIENH